MIFKPQQYNIVDSPDAPFIDPQEIRRILNEQSNPPAEKIRSIVDKSLARERLSLYDVAALLNAADSESVDMILSAASRLKKEVYGERIVIFAPLYIGNYCTNNCAYCGFRAGNTSALRRTLDQAQIKKEVAALEASGQKRLILVWGEHERYNAGHIAQTVRLVYDTHSDKGRINRVNINAAPFDTDDFRTIAEAGIGTYQIFQETYDPEVYDRYHLSGKKKDYAYRLTGLDRAMQAGIDDVGIGALFGLGDWKFEVMGLVRHTNHLEACFGVGPHTISVPRLRKISGDTQPGKSEVSDEDFTRLVAILRLAVPYTGMIVTAREPEALRNKLIELGVSQIDAGTNLEIGGYSEKRGGQELSREQFEQMDTRTLSSTVEQLIGQRQIPSFCTACYRKGRIGEHFMEFSTKGFIKRFCTPNALLTFAEYLETYADESLKKKGWNLIQEKVEQMEQPDRERIEKLLKDIVSGETDIFL